MEMLLAEEGRETWSESKSAENREHRVLTKW